MSIINVKVYRVEHHKTKLGPYRDSIHAPEGISNEHTNIFTHPCRIFEKWGKVAMVNEFLYKPYTKFGFQSLESLKKWFEGWLDILVIHGFMIVEYDVSERNIVIGSKQVFFKKKSYTKRYEIRDLIPA